MIPLGASTKTKVSSLKISLWTFKDIRNRRIAQRILNLRWDILFGTKSGDVIALRRTSLNPPQLVIQTPTLSCSLEFKTVQWSQWWSWWIPALEITLDLAYTAQFVKVLLVWQRIDAHSSQPCAHFRFDTLMLSKCLHTVKYFENVARHWRLRDEQSQWPCIDISQASISVQGCCSQIGICHHNLHNNVENGLSHVAICEAQYLGEEAANYLVQPTAARAVPWGCSPAHWLHHQESTALLSDSGNFAIAHSQ